MSENDAIKKTKSNEKSTGGKVIDPEVYDALIGENLEESAVIEISPDYEIPESHLSSFSWRNIDAWVMIKPKNEQKTTGSANTDGRDGSTTILMAENLSDAQSEATHPPLPPQGQHISGDQLANQKPGEVENGPIGSVSHHYHLADVVSVANETKARIQKAIMPLHKVTKPILRNISGYVRRGELVALMGSSGAGKTTLMNILTFRSGSTIEISGDVCINGIKTGPKEINAISAYIQQGDLLPGALTVREYLIFCACLKMDPKCTKRDRHDRVQEVIDQFGLTKCADTRIGIPGRVKGISGGEKRRVSVASEMLWNPELIFCDEPLSGLDSFIAEDLMNVMRFLTSKLRKTIICTIHQPSSKVYQMFDRSIYLADGRVAYQGTLDNAFEFFSELGFPCPLYANPSDFFIETLTITPDKVKDGSRARVAQICDAFNQSPLQQEIMDFVNAPIAHDKDYENMIKKAQKLPKYRASWMAQFWALAWRNVISIIHDPLVIASKIVISVLLGLIMGTVLFGFQIEPDQPLTETKYHHILVALYFMLAGVTILNIFSVLNVFHEELPLYLREHHNHMYRVDVYFIAQQMTDTPTLLLVPTLFFCICYSFIRLTWDFEDFIRTELGLIILSQVGAGFGYLISCATNSMAMALAIAPGAIIPLFLFGGFFVPLPRLEPWLRWIAYSSWFHWGNAALLPIQVGKVTSIQTPHCTMLNQCFSGPEFIDKNYDYVSTTERYWMIMAGMVAYATFFRLCAYIVLFLRSRKP